MIEIKRYKRTGYSFDVAAVRVTNGNLRDVAVWVDGEVRFTQDALHRPYVRVYTSNPKDPIRKAFPGDWIVKHDHGAKKVYNNDAFHKSFDEVHSIDKLCDEMTEPEALGFLRNTGVISEEEYQAKKSELEQMAVAE